MVSEIMASSLSPADALALISRGDIDLVDVREPHEWMTGHLPGARLLPLGMLTADLAGARLGAKVLVGCHTGGRSARAADLADARGVGETYLLEGGTAAWRAAGMPVEQPASAVAEEAAPEIDAIVGENIKALRARHGFTLDVLAGMSGVGRQTLGLIELGRMTPSLGTLWKIANAFDVPFAVLLARPGSAETRLFRAASAKKIVDADGRFASRALFHPEDTGGSFEFYELWLAGHGREDADAHAAGTRENLLVTSGRLVLEIGKARHTLAKGDAIAFNADLPHSYINPGPEECVMSLVMTYRYQNAPKA